MVSSNIPNEQAGQSFPDSHSDTRRLESQNEGAGVFFDAAQEAAYTFAPLKAVLGAITAIYRNYEVRLRSPTQVAL